MRDDLVAEDLDAALKIDPVTGKAVHSEGLLQLSYEDEKRYGCDFDWDKDKTLPPNNPAKTILQLKNNLDSCPCNVVVTVSVRIPAASVAAKTSSSFSGGDRFARD
jgi:hypothetical protein